MAATDWRLIREEPHDCGTCPECGSPLNIWGICMNLQYHDDDTDPWRDQ